jgi:hypothetical protein
VVVVGGLVVDFEADGTVGTPFNELLTVILLEARYKARDSWRKYFENMAKSGQARDYHLSAHMKDFFLECRRMLKKDMTAEEYEAFRKKAFSDDPNELLEVFEYLDDYLYGKKLTRLDSKKRIDYDRPEAVNKAHGFS